MLMPSVTIIFFLTLKSIFQYGRPKMLPLPPSLLSIPRIGLRKSLTADTPSLNMLTGKPPEGLL